MGVREPLTANELHGRQRTPLRPSSAAHPDRRLQFLGAERTEALGAFDVVQQRHREDRLHRVRVLLVRRARCDAEKSEFC